MPGCCGISRHPDASAMMDPEPGIIDDSAAVRRATLYIACSYPCGMRRRVLFSFALKAAVSLLGCAERAVVSKPVM